MSYRVSSLTQKVMAFLMVAGSLGVLRGQPNDEAYGDKIKEYTTDPRFVNELVDHLPVSESVPSPLEHFGDIIGAPGILHYTDEIIYYLRTLGEASGRVQVRGIGKTEENRDMIEVIIADEETIRDLDTYRGYLNRLADPRSLPDDEAKEIIANDSSNQGKCDLYLRPRNGTGWP